jgi:hypothetical protein
MRVSSARSRKLSLGAVVSSCVLVLLVSSGCGNSQVASEQPTESNQVAAVVLESTAEETAELQTSLEATAATVKPASPIEVEIEQPTAEAQLVRAETEIDSTETRLDDSADDSNRDTDLGEPTHKQVATIAVNSEGLEKTSLHCFCLSAEGNVLAACGQENGEIRLFDPDGKYLDSWNVSIKPEAINVGSDGNIYLAGNGKLLKLNSQGEVLLEKESPHVAAIMSEPEKVRQQVVERAKKRVSNYDRQLEMYQKMIDQLKEKDEEKLTERQKQSLKQLEEVYAQIEGVAKENGAGELSEEKIDEMVASMIEYKMRTASISEADGSVYLATGEPAGYGYAVWKMDSNFENAESIVGKLSGCCGQMDVQACSSGIYVAENSRHRVVRYDSAGTKLTSWGSRERAGLRGFGSCCNPMNVAFGPDGSVYTAESNSGRIKHYDSEGKLLSLVGKVDLVPGCKKVAISVSPDGGRVYMLDITRNTILVMGELGPGESIAYSETDQNLSANSETSGSVLNILEKAVGL